MESPQSKISEAPAPDEWAGLTDPAERRRRQNRINQRAHRRRQRMQAKDVHPKSIVPSSTSTSSSSPSPKPPTPSADLQLSLDNDLNVVGCMNPESRKLLLQFAHAAYSSYMLGSPTSDHLLMLTKVNVFRAFGHNMRLVGDDMSDMEDTALSVFNKALPSPPPGDVSPNSNSPRGENNEMPISLRPTKLQRTVPHHPWLDFFPIPKMRDNLIQAGDGWDDEKLCLDIMGFWSDATSLEAGLLVWGEPWDVRNWEVTEAFLKKWQWVVRGCPELMNSTNAWRAKRGEKLIFRYI